MPVRRLDPLLIDRIAAGEVIERPAAAVKELVENALDAGAHRVEVVIAGGGCDLIRVTDDGLGMSAADLSLAVERHATSKLPDGDLLDIRTLGFRGEALPSIASVARLEIRSRPRGGDEAFALSVADGAKGEIAPCAHPEGTRIEARDLFASTPARLKFLKTDRAEAQACRDAVVRLALGHSQVRFSFSSDIGASFDWPAADRRERIAAALGREFADNALDIDEEREGFRLSGHIAVPTFNKPNALSQFAYVNGRAVRDKLIAGALRAAFLDYLPRERHGAATLYLDCAADEVDVNVHPAKAEVRFRDAQLARGLVVGAVKRALQGALARASTTGASEAFGYLRAPTFAAARAQNWEWRASPAAPGFAEGAQAAFNDFAAPSARAEPATTETAAPLGAARAQLHNNYIVAQTRDGVVIVDQHAAHERIVYERLKRQREDAGIERQILLSPLVVDLDPAAAAALVEAAPALARLGLVVEPFGPGAALVRETPTLLAGADFAALVRDLGETLRTQDGAEDGAEPLERRLDHRLATIACHHSVRAGRALRTEEMNSLLREMEATPGAGQCNHGRPTYVELKLADIERLFSRR